VYFDTVSQLYNRFYEIHSLKLRYPYLSHLFTTPDKYPAVKREVQKMLRNMGRRKRHSFLLRERAAVALLLTFHEQAVYQWHHVTASERAFTKEVVDYLETRLLRNPRILWWWSEDRIGLAESYEELTRSRWREYVLSGLDQAKEGWKDAEGPLSDSATPAEGAELGAIDQKT
jgi:hypothetical protein